MSKNLQIYMFEEQLKQLISSSELEAGIIILILQKILDQSNAVYLSQIQLDYNDFLQKQKEANETDTKEFSIPITINSIKGQE